MVAYEKEYCENKLLEYVGKAWSSILLKKILLIYIRFLLSVSLFNINVNNSLNRNHNKY